MSNPTNGRVPLPLLLGTGAVIFLANAGLLVLQLVAGRMLAPFIGSSIETWTSVIGVFLTGIALGNWLGGRIADRFPSPKTVAVLLVLGGLSSIGMTVCYDFTLSNGFYRSIPLGPRIPILALLFCILPSLLLSLLTPLTIKLLLPDVGSAGRVAGLIFALSTLGCLIGNYFTGFWLMAEFTLNSIAMGVGIGLIALAVPIFFAKLANDAQGTTGAPPTESGPPDGAWNFRRDIRPAYAVVFVASFCGMSLELTGTRVLAPFLGVSLYTWTGIIGVMLAGTCCGNYLGGVLADRGAAPALRRFAFLVAALFGAAAGPIVIPEIFPRFNFAASRGLEFGLHLLGAVAGVAVILPAVWLSGRPGGRLFVPVLVGGMFGILFAKVSLHSFPALYRMLNVELDSWWWPIHAGGCLVGAGLALLFAMDAPRRGERVSRSAALSGTLFLAGLTTLTILLLLGMFSHFRFMMEEGDIVRKVFAWTFGLFFVPMLMLGAVSPQVIRLSVPDVQSAGRVAGNIYACSTAGAIAGTFVTGYSLIAAVGTFRVLLLLAFVLTLLAFLVGQLWKHNAALYGASIICGGAIFGLYIVEYGSNRYDLETQYYAIRIAVNPGDDLEDGHRRVRLSLDHLTHSYVDLDDPTWLGYQHEYVQGELLRAAYDKDPQTPILVIGGGGYTFPRYVQKLMPEVNVDVVEIDPGVTRIAYEKLGLPDAAKRAEKGYKEIHSYHLDGRQFVSERAAKGHYRLVIQDAVNDLSVPYHLMTKEYNDAVKATLTPDGAYLLTLIDSLDGGRLWRAAVNTMRQSFKFVYLLSPTGFYQEDGDISANRSVYIIYGADQPLDVEAVKKAAFAFRSDECAAARAMLGQLQLPEPFAILPEAFDAWRRRVWLHVLDDDVLDELLKRQKAIVLTDQYCPVDNLMSEVFRDRERHKY
jgi:hypothetical protein